MSDVSRNIGMIDGQPRTNLHFKIPAGIYFSTKKLFGFFAIIIYFLFRIFCTAVKASDDFKFKNVTHIYTNMVI